jgi:hypothetical protein
LQFVLETLYINKEDFFKSSKREFVDARMLFVHFFIKNYKGRKHGVLTVLANFMFKSPCTVLYYQENHDSCIMGDRMYRIKYTLLNQYFKYEYNTPTAAY